MAKLGTSLELPLSLPRGYGKRRALEAALRDSIKAGRLRPGEALPSTRSLATDLGVSRRLVVEAYEQLVSEGYLVSRERHRTEVATLAAPATPDLPDPTDTEPLEADVLRPGTPDLSAFPRRQWFRLLREALLDEELLAYPDPAGLAELRLELERYLRRVRAVACDAAQIRITGGLSGAITLWARCLVAAGVKRVALEHPGPLGLVDRLRRVGVELVPVPVDERGADVDRLAELEPGAVVLTPAHQFPLGPVLDPERRAAVLAWARDRDAWIFEDDYDAEYRFDGQPVGSLQGLAPDRVTTSSSVSKTLAPGLRLGWVVLPPSLLDPARDQALDLGQPSPPQYALARMLASGDYDRHVRRQRRTYRQRRRDLDLVLQRHPNLRTVGTRAGLHVTVVLDDPRPIIRRARRQDLELTPLGPYYWHHRPPDALDGLVLGYAALPENRWRAVLQKLERCLEPA